MSNDLISRSALKKAIKTECNPYGKPTIDFESGKKVLKIIDNAPTVKLFCSYLSDGEVREPCVEAPCKHERPQGEWINEYWEDAYQEYYHTCDVCKTEIVKTAYDNYCSCCGAKMRKGEEGEEEK